VIEADYREDERHDRFGKWLLNTAEQQNNKEVPNSITFSLKYSFQMANAVIERYLNNNEMFML
jgi:hypothetical protein